jgi:TPR repeat protein
MPGEPQPQLPSLVGSTNSAAPERDASSAPLAPAAEFNRAPRLPVDMFVLAQRYASGQGLEKDPQMAALWAGAAARATNNEATAWLEKLANSADPFACLYLGEAVQQKEPGRAAQLFKCALPALRSAAEALDARAEYALSRAYLEGYGVDKDVRASRQWLEKSAGRGYLAAMTALAVKSATGEGGAKNESRALELMTAAADRGFPLAQRNLGHWFYDGAHGAPKDLASAAKWWLAAARQGDAEAQYNFALMRDQGEAGKPDAAEAVVWYEKAAAQGEPSAENNLALKLEDGDGTPRDPKRAFELYQRAADAGNDATAQTNLARLYRDGIGVPVNVTEAQMWYAKAIAQGHEPAKRQLAQLKRHLECLATAQTKVFDVALKCATRADLRQAVARLGARATREDDDYWVDLYDSSKLLEGSTELSLAYTKENSEFARAQYTFPSSLDTEQVSRIAEMVAAKYGRPQRAHGDTSLGPVSYEWQLKDGLTLVVRRDWPDTTTYQEYKFPAKYAILEGEIAKNKEVEKAEQRSRQSHAF